MEILISKNILAELLPKESLIATTTEKLVGKTFRLVGQVEQRDTSVEVDLEAEDASKSNFRQAKFRYIDEDNNPFIISIGALVFLKFKDGSTLLDLLLAKDSDILKIPTSFVVDSASDRLWENGAKKFSAYQYNKFQIAKATQDFNTLMNDFNFINSLQTDVLHTKFAGRECLKDIIIRNDISFE